ncbi:protein FAM83H [Electrophorus electricus]|uniref:Scaffolding anchor of CK1 domain-containing protein n=1 Tax=Electrophorus electricus TaxID=8005 RepID=A0A4W4EXT5_ELEEL|nr:protein FAM83H [Electrophorus electricus]XP_026867491.2 protein FAM83H [Electrophorus electricus]
MAHRSQCSDVGNNPLDPNYLPPHYCEEYRLAIDALVECDIEGYYSFLQNANVVDFLSRSEIEHIKSTVKLPQSTASIPELPYCDVDQDGSSDTYWPLHSDLDAPGLDLGWPMPQHSFVGPTEVTTLVNPSDPEMPSIKEQARRLIKNAQQVIAVVMDMFTDVDIFADLLDAATRHVPVYILLDEQNAHHFTAMVTSCKVNLDVIHMMRVRTVAGITYFCRTGKSFKGQVMDRFLLADCRAVLSGNYSFMWSFEKIHRCMAHLFLGELVASFDEEFRILFAQSQPLVVENALVPMPPDNMSNYLSNQFGIKRTQSLRNPRGYLRHSELSTYPFGDRTDTALPFRRDDPFRHTMEPGGTGLSLQVNKFRMQQSFLEQGRSMVSSRQLEMNAYKRHSYAEGTHESYSSSRQYMKHRVMNNLEEMESNYRREQYFYQGEGQGPEMGRYDPLRSYGLHQLDQSSDPVYPPELEAPGCHNVLSSEDLSHDPGNKHHQGGLHYGPQTQKRPTVGQAYACQSSPTQLHPPDHKMMFPSGEQGRQSQDSSVKQGLRSWRINSYLSTCEDTGEEGMQQPMGADAFEEPQQQSELKPFYPEAPVGRFNSKELPNIQSTPKLDIRPRFGKPVLPEKQQEKDVNTEQASTGTDLQIKPTTSATSQTPEGTDSERETDSKETKEFSSKHEPFRSRINPMLQRSSRLRSSLIFSSSQLEQHSSMLNPGGKLQQDEENNSIRTSSIVAEILEKRRSLSREPFDWSKHKSSDEKDNKGLISTDITSKVQEIFARDTKDNSTKDNKEEPKPSVSEDRDITVQTKPVIPTLITPALNMNDPASRLQYFKELSAKRKDPKIGTESLIKSQEPPSKKPDLPNIPQSPVNTVSVVPAVPPAEPTPASTMQTDLAKKPPVVTTKFQSSGLSSDKTHRDNSVLKEESTETAKKEPSKESKSLKPIPSPKFFKRDHLKPFKSSHSRHTSCGEDILTDATDAEKSELKKSRSLSISTMPHTESKANLSLSRHGSNSSLNLMSSESKDTKPLDFFKKHTQRLKGMLGTKGEKKNANPVEDKQMKTVPENVEESSSIGKETQPELTSASENPKSTNKSNQARYQSSTSTALFSSNLRDDTKVILEQISANSQKNRQELTKPSEETEICEREHGVNVSNLDHQATSRYQSRNRFGRPPVNPQERDTLLKRIESMRKEKKVYSRFEMGNNLG